ncbi:MAG: helix-turn-helix domain-containing protein [Clostridiales bacterium]|jgi:two-component system response regulator YesN|nr:helix-turn-helix domain-containing protein [Clostridiales bacterium]
MRKLLIVDDERHVVNWLYELLSLETNLELVLYKAYSAQDALRILAETKIDIVLSDIKMPGMTGLELMEHIYKRWPFCRVIILTGYPNFESIYHSERNYPEAIFLMKTEDDDVIINAVKQQLDKIDSEIRTLRLKDEYETKSLIAARNLFLKNLSDGIIPTVPQSLMDELKLNMDVSHPFMLAAGKLTHTEGKTSYTRLFEIQSVVRKYVSHLYNCAQWTDNGEIFYWLMQPVSALPTQTNTRDLFEDVQSAFDELMGFESSFVLSGMFALSELPLKAAQISSQLQYNASTGVTAVLMEHNKTVEEEIAPLNLQMLELLETNLFLGKRELFINTIQAVAEPMNHIKSMHHAGALEIYTSISLILQRHMNRIHAREQLAFRTSHYKLTRPDLFPSWREATAFLTNTALLLFDIRNDRKEGYQLQIVGSIKQFIHNNLNSGLSLVTIADKMNYNPSYISRMFKRIEGMNLSDFINAARMAEAKKLLLKGGLSMNEISAAVGYDSPQYFATVFRKLTGLTPHQFQLENLIKDTLNAPR